MKRITWIGVTLTIPILAWAQTPGLELYREGKHAEAASVLAAEVEKSPEDKDLLTHLGLARIHAGDPGAAVEPLKKAIAIDCDYAEAHFGLGLANVKMKNNSEAIAELEKATKLAPNHAYAH
jgi:type IV pilus assembly protein PilF